MRGVYVDVVSYFGDGPVLSDASDGTPAAASRYTLTALLLIGASLLGALLYQNAFMQRLLPFMRRRILSLPNAVLTDAGSPREGSFMRSMLEEAAFAFTLSAHHLIAGSLMLLGQALGRPYLWLAGIAFEMGYEVADTWALARNEWPYAGLKSKWMKIVPLMHHVPTLLLLPVIVRLGYHKNENVQTLGWSLIGAGGVGFLAEGLKKIMDKSSAMWGWLAVHALNAVVMFLCRLVIFPRAAASALASMHEDKSVPPAVYDISRLGLGSLMGFNLIIMMAYAWKLALNLTRAFRRSSAEVTSTQAQVDRLLGKRTTRNKAL